MNAGQKIGYKRVSTLVQNTDRQLADLELDRVFEDHASGKNTDQRPQLQELMQYVRSGDVVYVHSMDRLARNLRDLLKLTEFLLDKGVEIHFIKENLTFEAKTASNPMSKLLMMILGAVAEFERSLILERQREGIAIAKARGAFKGRRPISEAKIAEVKKLVLEGKRVSQIARELGLSRGTVYKYSNMLEI